MNGIEPEDQIDLIRHILWDHDEYDPLPHDIIPMLLQALDVLSYFPTIDTCPIMKNRGSMSTCSRGGTHECQGMSLLNDLSIDSNHSGILKLINALPPGIVSIEAQRTDYVYVEYTEQLQKQHQEQRNSDNDQLFFAPSPSSMVTIIKEFNLFHTPFQSAWEGTLYHCDECLHLNSINNINDLLLPQNESIENLWKTTLHLIQAVTSASYGPSSSSLSLSHSSSSPFSSFNLLHAIAKIGHKAHSAVLWFAIRLYKNLLTIKDSNGNLPIHIASSNFIYYKSVRSQLEKKKEEISSSHQKPESCLSDDDMIDDTLTTITAEDQAFKMKSSIYNNTLNNTKDRIDYHIPQWDQPPILNLLQEEGRQTASIPDAQGRLPLHILLSNHDTNQAQLDDIDSFFQQNLRGREYDEVTQVRMSNRNGYAMDTSIVVRELVGAYPYSIHCVDPTNGLHPFFQAATSKTVPLDVVNFLLTENLDLILDRGNITDQNKKSAHEYEYQLNVPSISDVSNTSEHSHKPPKRVSICSRAEQNDDIMWDDDEIDNEVGHDISDDDDERMHVLERDRVVSPEHWTPKINRNYRYNNTVA